VDVLPQERRALPVKPLKIKRSRGIKEAGTDRGFYGKTNGDETQMTTKSRHEQLPNVVNSTVPSQKAKLLSLRCRGGF